MSEILASCNHIKRGGKIRTDLRKVVKKKNRFEKSGKKKKKKNRFEKSGNLNHVSYV